jgi:hypothetical protein
MYKEFVKFIKPTIVETVIAIYEDDYDYYRASSPYGGLHFTFVMPRGLFMENSIGWLKNISKPCGSTLNMILFDKP